MLFDTAFVGKSPQGALTSIVETLQSSTEYSLVGTGLDRKIALWNEGARLLYGYEAEEVLGKSTSDILFAPEDLAAGLPQTLREAARDGKWEGIVNRVRKNGEQFEARDVLTPHTDASGSHLGYLLISRDVAREVPAVQAIERFRDLLESVPDAMMVVDLAGRILFSNSQTEKLFGYSRVELLGWPVEFLVPERFRTSHSGHRNAFSADPGDLLMGAGREIFGRRRDGSEFPVEINLSPLEAEGRTYIISAIRDVTYRKKAHDKFRVLLESAPDAMVVVNHAERIVLVNSRAEILFGYPRAELLDQSVDMLVPERYRHNQSGYRSSYFCDPRVQPPGHGMELFALRKDGTEFPIEISLSRVETEDSILVSSSIRDVSERKQFERTQHVAASGAIVLFSLAVSEDEILTVSWTSDNFRDIFGYPSGTALGSAWWEASIHPEDVARVMAQTKAGLFTLGHSAQEYRLRYGDGNYHWTRCEIRLIRKESDRPVEAVGSWSDITDLKIAEQAGCKLREQVQQAQKLEIVGRLAGGVAHDFNNLLTVINGYSDMLLKQLAPSNPMHDLAAEIRTAGEQAATLVSQLLIFSRKQVVQVKNVNLNEVVDDVQRMLGRVIGDNIRLESSLDPSLGCVVMDPGQLHQVLMNLALNARDAMVRGGTLLFKTANVDLDSTFGEQHPGVTPGPYVKLQVKDTGTGMTKEAMAHVFEPFFTTKQPGEGTGLGLATVYGIIKQSNGSIWVQSEPAQGTTFEIYLPRVERSQQAPVDPKDEAPALHGTESVLVVEDQDPVRKMVGRVLRSHGYDVHEAANPEDALLQAARHEGPIHLLLTDVVMPGMSGQDLADRLMATRPDMDIIFMSGYNGHALSDHKLSPTAGGYLAKPFSPQALARKVREVIDASRTKGSILVADEDAETRGLLREILMGAGYHVLEAISGKDAIWEVETSDVDLMIMALAMPEREGIETMQALRRERPRLKIIAMAGKTSAAALRMAELIGANAVLAKPIPSGRLLEIVRRMLRQSDQGGLDVDPSWSHEAEL